MAMICRFERSTGLIAGAVCVENVIAILVLTETQLIASAPSILGFQATAAYHLNKRAAHRLLDNAVKMNLMI